MCHVCVTGEPEEMEGEDGLREPLALAEDSNCAPLAPRGGISAHLSPYVARSLHNFFLILSP